MWSLKKQIAINQLAHQYSAAQREREHITPILTSVPVSFHIDFGNPLLVVKTLNGLAQLYVSYT